MKGLVCAGGEATRLGELTRVTNKHLLPVGRWPMIYYPLQLLERAGLESVLRRHGQGPRGADDRPARRRPARPSAAARRAAALARPTYKVQTEAGRDRPGRRAWRATSPGARSSSSCSATTSSSARRLTRSGRGRRASDGALIFVKEVPDPENFGVVVYDDDGRVTDIVEKAGVVDTRYDAPPIERRRRRPLLLPAGRLRRDRPARAVEPRRARDHRRQPPLRAGGPARRRPRRGLVGGRGQALAAPRGDRAPRRRDGRQRE